MAEQSRFPCGHKGYISGGVSRGKSRKQQGCCMIDAANVRGSPHRTPPRANGWIGLDGRVLKSSPAATPVSTTPALETTDYLAEGIIGTVCPASAGGSSSAVVGAGNADCCITRHAQRLSKCKSEKLRSEIEQSSRRRSTL
jgi:hypothetical protein